MTHKELKQLGLGDAAATTAVQKGVETARLAGLQGKEIRKHLRRIIHNPAQHLADAYFAALAKLLDERILVNTNVSYADGFVAPLQQWGRNLEPESVKQIEMACRLPISVRGALMPDAHLGYGLPIGGVLATRNAVIPYAVGVDIACRVKLSVFPIPPQDLQEKRERFEKAIQEETRFGVGSSFKDKRAHAVLDQNWNVSPVTRMFKDKAWSQLGTSGSGNHFVEFGVLELDEELNGVEAGKYLALLSHSGSRGTGAEVCSHYSKIAQQQCRGLQYDHRHLAWLGMDSDAGQEYWAAMNLMGDYASANHACIHAHIARNLGVAPLLSIENHHNFAWKETHDGEEVIVHRKGATPAGEGVLGVIPGSMVHPAFIVRGKGNAASLNSAAHGAGRVMSRTQANKTFRWRDVAPILEKHGVTLISAGLDEVPGVYKNIEQVMSDQQDLVEPLARFYPKLVKMAPAGERPED